eukprot:5239202-Alexandrium_andersonii.AAC.1
MVVSWNSCSLKEAGRLDQISYTFRHAAIVMLIGTACEAPHDLPCWTQGCPYHRAYHVGWTRGGFSNKSAGVAVLLR